MKNKKSKILLTNLVTMLRAIGVFALVPVYKIYGGFITTCLSVFCFATDTVDGLMARTLGTSTFFGSLFDGATDKIFLISNMILLMGIFPHAWVLILFELGIAGVQALKYKENLKVKSNIVGKIKMGILGVSMSLTYLTVDPNLANYLGASLASKIQSIDRNSIFMAMILSELATLSSYMYEFFKEKKEVDEQKDIKEELKKDIQEKDLSELLFDPDFYKKYKDSSNLMEMTEQVLTRKRVKK